MRVIAAVDSADSTRRRQVDLGPSGWPGASGRDAVMASKPLQPLDDFLFHVPILCDARNVACLANQSHGPYRTRHFLALRLPR